MFGVILMISSSGNLELNYSSIDETSLPIARNEFVKQVIGKTSFWAKKPWVFKTPGQWYNYIFVPNSNKEIFRNIFVDFGIKSSKFEKITSSYLDDFERWVILQMAQDKGYPILVAEVAQKLKEITKIEDIYFKIIPDKRHIQFIAFVFMPKYDDELMDQLLDIEIDATRLGREHNYTLDFDYRPLPFVGSQKITQEGYKPYLD
jgi:hypothetical protein